MKILTIMKILRANVTIRKNIFAYLFSVHHTISLSRHEKVCLMRRRFERYFSRYRAHDGRSISRNVASLNILVHDVINLLYYKTSPSYTSQASNLLCKLNNWLEALFGSILTC